MRSFALKLSVIIVGAWVGACTHATTAIDIRDSDGAAMCQLHHEELVTRVAPIRYGLVGYRLGYPDAHAAEFPNARTWYAGGCTPGSEKEVIVQSCPACERAELAWNEAHSDTPIRR
jgi:hypothetical protein